MRGAALALLLASLGLPAAAADRPGKVGVTEILFTDAARNRPLATQLWYPAAADAREADLHYERAFRGRAAVDARPGGTRHPLVLLSHGLGGGKSNQSWLAEALAARGYVVAAIDHWNDTRAHGTPEGGLSVWERPQDLSHVLSALLAHPSWSGRIDAGRVGAAGHSSGGYTALALLGARYAPLQMLAYCQSAGAGADCAFRNGARLEKVAFANAGGSWRDPRVRAAFAMAPALGPGMDPDSLRAIAAPVQIVAAENDEILPFHAHAAHYASLIPGARLLSLPDGGHFVFMPRCNVPATVFTWFHRFDICGRHHDADRAAVHAAVGTAAAQFFDRALGSAARAGTDG
jgi:predicted dienelactone hydrolase